MTSRVNRHDYKLTIDAFPSLQDWAEQIADQVSFHVKQCQFEGILPKIALPGGETIAAVLPSLLGKTWQHSVIDVVVTDERVVPCDDERRNDRKLRFGLGGIAQIKVHSLVGSPMPTHKILRKMGKKALYRQSPLSLMVLGMGVDGHIASLFPREQIEDFASSRDGRDAWVQRGGEEFFRVTMDWRTIEEAGEVWLIMTGDQKMRNLQKWICDQDSSRPVLRLLATRPVRIFWTPMEITT